MIYIHQIVGAEPQVFLTRSHGMLGIVLELSQVAEAGGHSARTVALILHLTAGSLWAASLSDKDRL